MNTFNHQRVLVIAAHPDDEVLGCGGTIARLSQEEHQINIAILGEGITSRHNIRQDAVSENLLALEDEARSAAKLLGAESVVFSALPDNRFDELPLLDVVKQVEQRLEEFSPEIVYTHHPGDLNIDHRITFQAVLTATRPIKGCIVREVYAFEIPSSTEWAFQRFEPSFRPNVFVDISATLVTKIKAMNTYKSEVRPAPHPRSPEALTAIATRWGSVVGMDHAEAFELIRLVR